MEDHSVAGSGDCIAELKAAIAWYDALRESAHADASAVITAGCRLRAMIMAKQLINIEPSELLEAAYAEATLIISLLEGLTEALSAFQGQV
ncbi:hypothetical protein [Streptomyces sp. NBC_00986]|uniref:hypothetical protein n=1 Tax=Streptomyces sp. NBC_00986 TaxID=2903702 RepID=UPI00386A9E62|nr:hypothetical protein OG504_33060 [Streptomyces sp. NBC_00986]